MIGFPPVLPRERERERERPGGRKLRTRKIPRSELSHARAAIYGDGGKPDWAKFSHPAAVAAARSG